MQQLPDITIPEDESLAPVTTERRMRSAGFLLASIMVLVLCMAVSVGTTLIGRDAVLSLLGIHSEQKPDPYRLQIEMLVSDITLLNEAVKTLKTSVENQMVVADTQAFNQSKMEQRLKVVEHFSSALEQRIKKYQADQAQQKQNPQRVALVKPKPVPVIPPVLVSIRSIAGTPFAAIREGMDHSALMMPGDSWKGWTFVDADIAGKRASFRHGGVIQELRL